jgi:deazaflavin-dependent oxidoreductase (nitroreductase family)
VPIPKAVARFNRHVTNPIARLVASWLPPFAVVVHRGRVSGRVYRTPVWAFRTSDWYVVALTYGADSDWVRNVLKTGAVTLRRAGRTVRLARPRIVAGTEGLKLVPAIIRVPLRLLRATEFLQAFDR